MFPACQNLLLAAHALGYGGVLTGWHGPVEPELRAELGIPDGIALHGCITLGVPAGRHGPLRRKPLGTIIQDGVWGRDADWLGEWGDCDHPYAGVGRRARRDGRRAAGGWRRLARQVHPDRAGGTAAATAAMQRLNVALDVALARLADTPVRSPSGRPPTSPSAASAADP